MKLVHRTFSDKDESARRCRALGEACSGTGPAHMQRGVSVYACSVGCRRRLQILGVGVGVVYAYRSRCRRGVGGCKNPLLFQCQWRSTWTARHTNERTRSMAAAAHSLRHCENGRLEALIAINELLESFPVALCDLSEPPSAVTAHLRSPVYAHAAIRARAAAVAIRTAIAEDDTAGLDAGLNALHIGVRARVPRLHSDVSPPQLRLLVLATGRWSDKRGYVVLRAEVVQLLVQLHPPS